MEGTDLFPGAAAQRPGKLTPSPKVKRQTAAERAAERRLERTARFYEHIRPDPTDCERNFRHGHWHARRRRIRELLVNSGISVHALNRWDACGSECVVQYSAELQKFRLAANYCKHRHCEPCMRAKANLIARNLRDRLEEIGRKQLTRHHVTRRFITLTLKHSRRPLVDQIRRLMASFKKLRAAPCWKNAVRGGAAVLEVKWTGSAWHPHLHAITEGDFIDKAQLSAAWHEATGDSFIVDVRALAQVEDACHYLAKYITKGTNAAVWDNTDTAQEWITAVRGVRTCNTFGSWRGFRLTASVPQATDWTPVGSLDSIVKRAEAGELAAQAILLQLRPPGTADADPRSTLHPP